MLCDDIFAVDFDKEKSIIHIAYKQKVVIETKAQLEAKFSRFQKLLDRYSDGGHLYVIINVSNLIIEPGLSEAYARLANEICEKSIYPNGIARYGYQITRLTVRKGYADHLKGNPNIFASREEAYDYILGLIENVQENRPITDISRQAIPRESN